MSSAMEAIFLILTAAIAGYVAYAYVFVRKRPTPRGMDSVKTHECEEGASHPGFKETVLCKPEELKELEAFSLAVLSKDPKHGEASHHEAVKPEVPREGGRKSQTLQSLMKSFHSWAFDLFLAEERRARMRAKCLHEFPEMLDILTLGLKAGLSFDGALALYTARYNSLLSALLSQGMLVWKLGLSSRVNALETLSSHLQIGAFTRFSTAVAEALEFGIPLADSLSRQATEIRREQRLQVEEGIEKIPVKMLIPMGVFVVPAMLLAILGPLLSSALGT